jgi:DNA polymerase I-like protein with 3'-5' exonuclease and polymerase domains
VDVDKNGKKSVGEKNIAKYQKQFPFIKDYLEYKGIEKLVGTYGENFQPYQSKYREIT